MTVTEPTLWDQPPDLPRPKALARRTDEQNAHDTAASLDDVKLTHDQELFLLAHYEHQQGLSDFDVARLVGKEQTAIGPRRPRLMKAGLIEVTDERRLARPGQSTATARVYKITTAGVEVARRVLARKAAA